MVRMGVSTRERVWARERGLDTRRLVTLTNPNPYPNSNSNSNPNQVGELPRCPACSSPSLPQALL